MTVGAGSCIVVRNTHSVYGFFGRQSWPKPPNLNARLTAACVHNILRL